MKRVFWNCIDSWMADRWSYTTRHGPHCHHTHHPQSSSSLSVLLLNTLSLNVISPYVDPLTVSLNAASLDAVPLIVVSLNSALLDAISLESDDFQWSHRHFIPRRIQRPDGCGYNIYSGPREAQDGVHLGCFLSWRHRCDGCLRILQRPRVRV